MRAWCLSFLGRPFGRSCAGFFGAGSASDFWIYFLVGVVLDVDDLVYVSWI